MRTNPFSDALSFLTGATDGHAGIGWGAIPFVALSLALVIASFVIAWRNWRSDPAQRTARNVALWLMRACIGAMWLEGSLWKLPLPVAGGFRYWLGLMADNAAFAWYGEMIKTVLVANIAVVNPIIFLVEVSLAASLMLGVAVRLTALLGVGMALNLWIGLYRFQPEWPWGYVFIAMLHVFFIIDRAGRALGVDAMLQRGLAQRHRVLDVVT